MKSDDTETKDSPHEMETNRTACREQMYNGVGYVQVECAIVCIGVFVLGDCFESPQGETSADLDRRSSAMFNIVRRCLSNTGLVRTLSKKSVRWSRYRK
jgi:hypothetical protein